MNNVKFKIMASSIEELTLEGESPCQMVMRLAFEKDLPKSILHRKKNPYPKTHSPIYKELISKYTIRQCLENLNKLGICTIDVDGILRNSWVIRADITKDVDLPLSDDVLQRTVPKRC